MHEDDDKRKSLSGQDFKIWRLSRGLSQKDVGEMMGLHRQGIQWLEKKGLTRLQHLGLSFLEWGRGKLLWQPTEEDREAAKVGGYNADQANESDPDQTP